MCCEDDFEHGPVATLLERYRALLASRGLDWGDDRPELMKALGSFAYRYEDEYALGDLQTLPEGVEAVLGEMRRVIAADGLPPRVAIERSESVQLPDPLPFAIADHPFDYDVFVRADGNEPATVRAMAVSAERPQLEVGRHRVRAVDVVGAGRVRLRADAVSRWTVLDERGGAWFPDGALRKYDYYGRPFFHGNDLTVDVPAGRITVTVARGCEFRSESATVDVLEGREISVNLSPNRIYDAAARGWYGGDLHVHMNYSGDQVCTLRDAALMQQGEGLHLMTLQAANENTSLIYDRETFEHFVGRNLPWSRNDQVARMGVEYRNNLFGHFNVLGPTSPPQRYQSGHPRSDEPQDWPPNAVVAEEFRQLGATISYTHPFQNSVADLDSLDDIFADYRAHFCEAKEIVADAALGLVDSIDLTGISFQDLERTEYVYHRLLGCGIRLAATAGSDIMMSRSRNGSQSNPPGWCRAYADLRGQQLSIPAWQEAVRAGRTFSTNGPWLELDARGHGPGDTIAGDGAPLPIVARVAGLGVEKLEVIGPDGPLASVELSPDAEEAELATDITVSEPIWIVARARGRGHQATLGPEVYAHTSPIWVTVGGRSVARPADAAWCLEWLDRFEALTRRKGNFVEPGQLDDLVKMVDRARNVYRGLAANGAASGC